MAKKTKTYARFIGGISDFIEEGIRDSYAFGRHIDIRSNPRQISLLARAVKESASYIQALPKWGEYVPLSDELFIYDERGNIYKKDTNDLYSLVRTVANSHGNGMSHFAEDNFVYYTSDKLLGRYGPVGGDAPTFVDDFLGSQGGVRLNTHALDLEAASTQYLSRADTADLSVTGNLTLEAHIKPESLPTGSGEMTLISKWTENGNLRSYKFGIGTISNYFGDGSDGALTISSNTTEAPIDSACTGTSGAYTLSATNASFAADQEILIHQTRGTGAGAWMKNTIQSYTAGTITLVLPLNTTYVSGAQVRVLKQYTNVTINSGITYTAKAWDGTVGGILAFLANGTVTVTGTITASGGDGAVASGSSSAAGGTGGGFRGGATTAQAGTSNQGEGTSGAGSASTSANGSGGGGGKTGSSGDGASGGGGGHAATGAAGQNGATGSKTGTVGSGGGLSGSADLTTLTFGGGGGGGASPNSLTNERGGGGSGGGIVFIAATDISVGGGISSNGGNGGNGYWDGGGGAGGSVFIKAQTAALGTNKITASGGTGGGTPDQGVVSASAGRIHVDYLTSVTGTTTPTFSSIQDTSLGSSDGYTLKFQLSNDGTAIGTATKPATITTDTWQHVAVAYEASTGIAELFLNGVSLGTTATGKTSIHDNASTFNVGMDRDGSSNPQHLYDGLIDEVLVHARVRTTSELIETMKGYINVATIGLQGYWHLNNAYTDASAAAGTLTATGSPVFTTDTPFNAPTTRLDIDQSNDVSGSTYTVPTAISESAADRQTFIPAKDPQKSIEISVSAKGTGDVTVTVHDSFNNELASKTILAADMTTGKMEFIFDEPWRPLTNFTNEYHFHVTVSTGTTTILSSGSNDLETGYFKSYYQFLVEDTKFHPLDKFLQLLVIGNERYVGTYEGTNYIPHKIILPAGYNVWCFGLWREYLAIGTVKGGSLTDTDSGRIYFWDGISSFYNFFIDVPEGGVTALLGSRGQLHVWAGYQGDHLIYGGGDSAEKIKRLPKVEDNSATHIYPAAVTMWKSLLRYGAAGESDSTLLERGVYTYGKANLRYEDILTYDYSISTGSRGDSVRIGLVLPVKQQLLVGWGDGTGFGIDYIDPDNNCAPEGTIEFLTEDQDQIWKEKLANTFVSLFDPLTSGQGVVLKYKMDNDSAWREMTSTPTTDDTLARLDISESRHHEVQFAIDITSTSGVSPVIRGCGIELDDRKGSLRV